jgi:hypothetical protein
MTHPDDDADFVSQGELDVEEADRILPRLKQAGVRFEIDVEESRQLSRSFMGRLPVHSRVTLYVHALDLDAWLRIREEYFPV